ncbi:MAG: hypothetical protein ACFFD2_13790 [Promethearchaeota archaeon]
MQNIIQSIKENVTVVERNLRFIIKKRIPKTGKKLTKLLDFLVYSILLITYIFNRILKLKTGFISSDDYAFLYKFCQKHKIKKILEFGPGTSTYCFLKFKNVKLISYEYNQEWLKNAQEKFKNYPNIKICKFENKENLDIDIKETFDLAFIDSPLGSPSMSRLNTCLWASQQTNLIILHDARRKGEQETINYFETFGWKSTFINTNKGICLLTKSNLEEIKRH